jgi:hypothetical protein
MTEALTKQPTLAELKFTARVLIEEDPSLTAARYALRMQQAKVPYVVVSLQQSVPCLPSNRRGPLSQLK